MEKKRIYILTTGGTIEKTYDEVEGKIDNHETVLKQTILTQLRFPHTHVEVKYLMNKDSLQMDEQDRTIIAQAIERFSQYNHPIIVIHGTDTMDLTAKHCHESISNISVPVIFTGAMKPLGFKDSDALQNVTESLTAAAILKPGFYINFHNHIFTVPNVRKNKQKRTFEEVT
jgi:L-asparaginase